MQISWQRDDSAYAVSGVDGARVRIGSGWRPRSFWVHNRGVADWRPECVADITSADLDTLLAERPEVILLGTGTHGCLLAPALMVHVMRQGCGIECMGNAAAARTYNVLLAESRAVLAAFVIAASDAASREIRS